MNKRVKLDVPLKTGWESSVYRRLGDGPFMVQGYSKAELPPAFNWGSTSAAEPFSSIIFVRDATGGATTAFSDGSSWISTRTGSAV